MTTLTMDSDWPTSDGDLVDYYHDIKDLRLAMEKEVAVIAQREQAAKTEIMRRIAANPGTTGFAGSRYRAQRVEKRVPKVADWKALHAWVAATGRFDVLQKRLLNSAITDMWESDETVPGVEPAIAVDLSVTKI